jgi:hypothetical protein
MEQQVINSIADWLPLPFALVVMLGFFGMLYWIIRRTRSFSVVFERIWQLLAGHAIDPDRDAGAMLRDHRELIEIRFRFLPQLRTQRQLTALRSWLRSHDEDIGDIGRCGPNLFDVDALAVREDRLWPKRWLAAAMAVSILLAPLTLASSIAMWLPHPILNFRSSGTMFVLKDESARGLFNRDEVTRRACEASKAHPGQAEGKAAGAGEGFAPDERQSLCGLLADPVLMKKFRDDVPLQKFAFMIATGMCLFVAVSAWLASSRGMAAHELLERLKQRPPPRPVIDPALM